MKLLVISDDFEIWDALDQNLLNKGIDLTIENGFILGMEKLKLHAFDFVLLTKDSPYILLNDFYSWIQKHTPKTKVIKNFQIVENNFFDYELSPNFDFSLFADFLLKIKLNQREESVGASQ